MNFFFFFNDSANYVNKFIFIIIFLFTLGLVPESKSKMEEKRTLWSDPAS